MGKKWGGSVSRKGIVFFIFLKNEERPACFCTIRIFLREK